MSNVAITNPDLVNILYGVTGTKIRNKAGIHYEWRVGRTYQYYTPAMVTTLNHYEAVIRDICIWFYNTSMPYKEAVRLYDTIRKLNAY